MVVRFSNFVRLCPILSNYLLLIRQKGNFKVSVELMFGVVVIIYLFDLSIFISTSGSM